jgi:hypothetical protein
MRSVSTLARWLTQVRRSLGSSAGEARRERAVRRLRAHDQAADPWLAEERQLLSAPAVVLSVASATYTENAPPVTLDPAITASDPDADLITSAQIKIVDYEMGQDQLSFISQFGITGSFDNNTGILSLNGVATAGNYATVLSSVKYQNLTDAPSDLTRTIEFTLTDTEPATSPAATLTLNLISVADTPANVMAAVNEDTLSGPIVLAPNPIDGNTVTHFQITGITNGTLFQNDGVTQINNGDFITAADAAAGVRFQGNLNYFGPAEFKFQAAVGNTVGDLGGNVATASITVNPVADTPANVVASVNEDTLSGPIVLTPNAVDGATVTHFQITGITNGTLYLNDGVTVINNGDFVTVSDAAAGLKYQGNLNYFGPAQFQFQAAVGNTIGDLGGNVATASITVNPVADTPADVMANVNEDTLSAPIMLVPNPVDGASVTHFQITGITNGTLYQADGVTVINNGDFITLAQATAGVTFQGNLDYFGPAQFQFQASTSNMVAGLAGALATASITVNPIADTPANVMATVNEDTLSGPIVLTPNAVDGASVTHFQITGITNGTLYLNDGVTVVNNGDFVTATQAALGLKYQGNLNYFGPAEFKFQAAVGPTVGDLGGGIATASITVVSVNDNPTITVPGPQITNEGTNLALPGIVINDVDVGGNLLTVEFQTTGPTASYTLGTTTGITFLTGTNGGSIPLKIQGTLADLQAALATLSVQPHDNGLLALTLIITDELNGSNQATIPITVNNVAPTPTVTGATTGFEGTAINLTGSSTDPANMPTTPTDNDSVSYSWQVLRNGVLYTTGSGTNFVLLPNNEGTYQVFLTASDEDGGSATTVHTITVANVKPTPTITATDIDGQFYTYVDITVDDPGDDGITVTIDWSDISPDDNLNDPFVIGEVATTRDFGTVTHRYLIAPNPQRPLDPVTITFTINDGTDTVIVTRKVEVTGQGIPAGGVYLTPEPVQIVLPAPQVNAVPPMILTQPTQQQVRNEEIASRDDTLTDEDARLVLHVVGPTGVEGPAVTLPDGLLKNLRGLFAKLPDGHYRVYLVQGETRRLVIEVFVRQGRAIDPAEVDQGTQERAPQVQPAAQNEPQRVMQAEPVGQAVPDNQHAVLAQVDPHDTIGRAKHASQDSDPTENFEELLESVAVLRQAQPDLQVSTESEPESPENADQAGVLSLAAAGVVAGESWRRTARRQRAAASTTGPDEREKIEKTWSRLARRARQWKPR